MNATDLCLLAAGLFFLNGLLTGILKYRCIATSTTATAPMYVDIAHRTSLLYAFAAILMREFVPYSRVSEALTRWVVAVPLLFFASAILLYMLHGWLRDTDNQLRRPHMLGRRQLPPVLIQGYILALIVGEVGGFAVLLYGFLRTVV
jgi:hypothetical protein